MSSVREPKSSIARNRILEWIHSGRFVAGHRLPSERSLAQELSVTQRTVRRGMAALVAEGVIVKQPRVGNFVRDVRPTTRVAIVLPRYMLTGQGQHPALGLYVGGAADAFDQRDFLLCTMSYRPGQLWSDAGQVIAASHVQGVLLVPQQDVQRDDIERLLGTGAKLVLVGHHACASELGLATVDIDHDMALSQIMQRLIDLGHRRIVFTKYTYSLTRYSEADLVGHICRRANLGPASDFIFDVPNHEGSGQIDLEVLAGLLDREHPPTAIVAADEFLAAELFRLCKARRLRVPDDVSLAARWDNTPQAYPLPLTAPDSVSLARRAAQLGAAYLKRLLGGEPPPEREIHLRCDVRWTASIGPPPVRNTADRGGTK